MVRQSGRARRALLPAGRRSRLARWPGLEEEGGAALLSSERLTKVLSVEPENLLAIVEAGLSPEEVRRALEPAGLYWPVSGLDRRSLGAIMAEGALSLESMARGPMIDWILGSTFVEPSGRLISSGGRTLKNVSGYDLTRFHWRAWGSLGFSTAFILKCLPLPESSRVLEIQCASGTEAAGLAESVILKRIFPQALRLSYQEDRWSLLVWLTGFAEYVEARFKELRALAGDRPGRVHEEALDFWNGYLARWPLKAPGAGHWLGSRRAVLDLAAHLDWPELKGRPGRIDLDPGGGQIRFEGQAEAFAPLDAFETAGPRPEGEVYLRLKRGLDPADLFFPARLLGRQVK
jgi:FAD/FMN-containing dehydrogenase